MWGAHLKELGKKGIGVAGSVGCGLGRGHKWNRRSHRSPCLEEKLRAASLTGTVVAVVEVALLPPSVPVLGKQMNPGPLNPGVLLPLSALETAC